MAFLLKNYRKIVSSRCKLHSLDFSKYVTNGTCNMWVYVILYWKTLSSEYCLNQKYVSLLRKFFVLSSTVLLFNSLGHAREMVVKIHVSSPYVKVTDPEGNVVSSQIGPYWIDQHTASGERFKVQWIEKCSQFICQGHWPWGNVVLSQIGPY